ncbi:MAG: DMT family transporter [Campylobacterales bacterium]|nr:DMT family transporter [Campylobacterales bacterium]
MAEKSATMYALSAVFLWSSVATAFKLSLAYVTPVQLLVIASGVSLLVLGVLLWQQGKFALLRALPKKYILSMLFLGGINPFVYYLVLFQAYALLPAQEAQALNYTWALTLAYLSALVLKQTLRWQEVLAGVVCYGGVLVVATRGDVLGLSFGNPVGVALALASTLLWALYWIYSTKWALDPLVGLFLNFASGFVLVLGWAWMQGALVVMPWQGVVGAVYVGVFEMGITFFLWLQAMRLTRQTAKIANLIFLSPFLSLVFIGLVLGETILLSTVVGLVLIVLGLSVQKMGKSKETA